MAMNHAILDGSSTMYWDNDALNMAGVCATTDLDNGQLVTLKKINRVDNTGAVEGFEYEFLPKLALIMYGLLRLQKWAMTLSLSFTMTRVTSSIRRVRQCLLRLLWAV